MAQSRMARISSSGDRIAPGFGRTAVHEMKQETANTAGKFMHFIAATSAQDQHPPNVFALEPRAPLRRSPAPRACWAALYLAYRKLLQNSIGRIESGQGRRPWSLNSCLR